LWHDDVLCDDPTVHNMNAIKAREFHSQESCSRVEDTLRMPEIAAEISVAEFYEGVEFSAVPDDGAGRLPA
jgi:hypothetical protein